MKPKRSLTTLLFSRWVIVPLLVASLVGSAGLLWPESTSEVLSDVVEEAASIVSEVIPAPSESLAQAQERIVSARGLCRDGRYEDGMAALSAPVPNSVDASANLALAWCASLNGDAATASLAVELVQRQGEPSPEAKLLLARAKLDLGHHEAAVTLAAEVAEESALLSGYAHLLRGEALKGMGRPDEAKSAYALITPENTTSETAYQAARSVGEAYRIAGQPGDASLWDNLALSLAPHRFAQAELHVILGGIAHEAGDAATALQEWRLVVRDFYQLWPARQALEYLDAWGPGTIDDFQRGLILFYADRNAEAASAFARYLASQPGIDGEIRGLFFRALAERDVDNTEAALAQLEVLATRFPDHSLADDSIWHKGQIYEGLGDSSRAVSHYIRLLDAYPASEFAAQARFRLALSRYGQGALSEAVRQWETLASSDAPLEERKRALFWIVKGALGLGLRDQAVAAHARLLLVAPQSYQAYRAADLLAGKGYWPEATVYRLLSPPKISTETLVDWVASWSSVPAEPTDALPLRVQRALALLEATQRAHAEAEVQAWLGERPTPFDLARSAAALHEAGLPAAALRVGTQLANLAPCEAASSPIVQSLIYPAAYLSLVDQEAWRHNLDPRLLLALVRQESLFDSVAGSTAGALGLTQVIPSTGRDIAAHLSIANFQPEQLFRPATSLRFGADYLAQMLRQFNRDPVPALAAYNGGPGSAARWRNALSSYDPDLYIEAIDFTETRRYVPLVLEHYAQYLALYPASDP